MIRKRGAEGSIYTRKGAKALGSDRPKSDRFIPPHYYIELSIGFNNYYFFSIITLVKKLIKLKLKPISKEPCLYYSN